LDDVATDLLVAQDRRPQLLDGVREGVVADVVQQGRGRDGVEVGGRRAEGGVERGPQGAQGAAGEGEDAEGMLEAAVLGARPDARDEAELLDAVQAEELGRAEERDLARPQRDAVVEAVADRGGALLVAVRGLAVPQWLGLARHRGYSRARLPR